MNARVPNILIVEDVGSYILGLAALLGVDKDLLPAEMLGNDAKGMSCQGPLAGTIAGRAVNVFFANCEPAMPGWIPIEIAVIDSMVFDDIGTRNDGGWASRRIEDVITNSYGLGVGTLAIVHSTDDYKASDREDVRAVLGDKLPRLFHNIAIPNPAWDIQQVDKKAYAAIGVLITGRLEEIERAAPDGPKRPIRGR